MSCRIDNLIEQCAKGGIAADIIREIEEELPDVKSIQHDLHRDLKNVGVNLSLSSIQFENDQFNLDVPPQLVPSKSIIESVLSVYNSTYPEFEFFTES